MPINRTLFVKLMMMTASTNDKEALTALRKANTMLTEQNMNWEEFVNGGVRRSQPKGRGTGVSSHDQGITDPKIANMLDALISSDAEGGFRVFLESIEQFWNSRGYLTERQYAAIVKAYDNLD